jgi:hypothetical protein
MSELSQSWRNALYGGLFFGLVFGVVNAVTGGIAAALASAVVGGGLFALLIGLFMSSPVIPKTDDIELHPGEAVLYSGLANHFLNFEGRGGRLALTPERLVFKPHAVNVQRSELSIPRADIAGVAAVRTFGLIPNGLAVTLKSGKVEKFAVNGRETWLAKLAPKTESPA